MREESSSAENERKAVRRWHRSRLFWLGIPGLLFLIWSSLGDPSRFGMLGFEWGEHSVGFMDHQLTLRIEVKIPEAGPLEPFSYRYIKPTISKSLGEKPGRFPPAVESMGWHDGRRGKSGVVSIAYWFMAGVYLGVWGGVLAMRQWRKARLARRRTVKVDGGCTCPKDPG